MLGGLPVLHARLVQPGRANSLILHHFLKGSAGLRQSSSTTTKMVGRADYTVVAQRCQVFFSAMLKIIWAGLLDQTKGADPQ